MARRTLLLSRSQAGTGASTMSNDDFDDFGRRKAPPKRAGKPARPDPSGPPKTGRISQIARGQGHGYIRLRNDREVYFHRGDVQEGTAFNDLAVGDRVAFELFEDQFSGPRALRLTRQTIRR
jgi:cold shock CspA family protein